MRGIPVLALAALLGLVTGCAEKAPKTERLMVFAVDGADWDRAVPLMRQGKLPTLSRLVRTGARRTLRSLEPERLSPTIWTTAATGVLPERHGIHHFVTQLPDGEVQPVTSNQREVAALWNILTARERTVGVLGWLATWPAEPVNGYLVSSYTPYVFRWGADRPIKGTLLDGIPDQVWPASLQEELEALKVLPDSVADADLVGRFSIRELPEEPSEDAAQSLEGMRWGWATDATYLRIFRHLAASRPRPELEMLYFGSVDVVSHRFWKYMAPETYALGDVDRWEVHLYGQSVEAAYRSLDGVLGDVLGVPGNLDRLIVLSDHGFRENLDPKRATSSGWHRPEGLLLAEGDGIRRGALLDEGSVVDVAPTVLYALGLPVARDLDGEPALDLFSEEHRAGAEIEWIESWEPEVSRTREATPRTSPVDDEILTRLKALGYLD